MNTLYAKIVNDNYLCLDCAIEQDGVLVDVAQERNEYSYVCDVLVRRCYSSTRGDYMSLLLCEICEVNTKTYIQGKWCDDCRDDFKTSEDDK
jgi:hypothetical protein